MMTMTEEGVEISYCNECKKQTRHVKGMDICLRCADKKAKKPIDKVKPPFTEKHFKEFMKIANNPYTTFRDKAESIGIDPAYVHMFKAEVNEWFMQNLKKETE